MRIKIGTRYFFFIAYILYLFSAFYPKTAFYIVENRDIEFLLKMLRYVAYILLVIYGLCEKHNKRMLFLFTILFAVLMLMSIESNRVLLFSIVFVYFAKKINYKSIIKCSLYFMIAMWIVLIIAMAIGIIDNILIYTSDLVGGRYRYCLGFKHPNNATQYFLLLVMQFFWLKKDKIRFRYFLESIVLVIIVYILALSRTGIIISLIFHALVMFRKYLLASINKFKIVEILICYILPVLAIFNIIMTLMYTMGHFQMIDALLHGRVALASKMIKTMGFSLWGQAVEWNYTTYYNVVDSSYIRDLIEYGIIGYIVIMLGYVSIMKYAIKERDMVLVIAIISIAIDAISENMLMYFPINPFIVMFGAYFRIKKGRKNHEKSIEAI